MTGRKCDFPLTKTHEFCMREADGTWSKTWWQCSAAMATTLRLGDPSINKFQIREIPQTGENK